MSSCKEHKWVRAFKDGRENVYDESLSGRSLVITDNLVNAMGEKIREERRFTIPALDLEFQNVGITNLHKILYEKLKFHKFCARRVPRLLIEEQKLKRMACDFDFFWIDIIINVINF